MWYGGRKGEGGRRFQRYRWYRFFSSTVVQIWYGLDESDWYTRDLASLAAALNPVQQKYPLYHP